MIRELKEPDDYFRIGTPYPSKALEGKILTISKTKVIIEDDITTNSKPLSYKVMGHAKAYDYILQMTGSENLHRLFYGDTNVETEGKYRIHQVFITGTEYLPPILEEIEELMWDFIYTAREKNWHASGRICDP